MSEAPRPMTMAEYHAIKALSAGMIWTMDSECPAKAFIDSPWNPAREPVNATHFDIGTAAHLAVLEPTVLESRTVIVRGLTKKGDPSPGYSSADAKEQRDFAYAAGFTPLLPEQMEVVEGMQKAVHAHPMAAKLFTNGMAEVSLTWEWERIACKCRPDYLAADLSYVLDLKTANTANPRAVARKAFNEGWFVRAAWYMNGIMTAMGKLPDRYLFVVTEKDAPHLIEIFELDARALLAGEQIIERTIPRAGACLSAGHWPSYGDGEIVKLSLPTWGEFQLAEKDTEE